MSPDTGNTGTQTAAVRTTAVQTTITDITAVGIPVTDQDKALEFFTGTLGFDKRLDLRRGEDFRWVTVGAPGAAVSVALVADGTVGIDTGIRFMVPDAETEYVSMRERGIKVGELLRWPGVPPMYEFRDPDGNRYEVVEVAEVAEVVDVAEAAEVAEGGA